MAAAVRGAAVTAVERRKEVGVPVQCAEFIPLPMAGYAKAEGVSRQRIRGMVSTLPSGSVARTPHSGIMVDRAAFDQALAREAEASGARLCLECRLTGIDGAASVARVATPQGEIEFAYKALIAADGARSHVAADLGLPRLEVVHTRQYTVPLEKPSEETRVWLSAALPGGYAWLFPKGNLANLGVGADKRFAGDLKKPLDALHRELVCQGVVGETILARTGGEIPVGGLRERLVVGNILFAGDAAGLAHPITGAGIAAAVVSGEGAGRAAADWIKGKRDALEQYEQDIRDQFEAALRRAVARRCRLARFRDSPEAGEDRVYRSGWIAFPEYFAETPDTDEGFSLTE